MFNGIGRKAVYILAYMYTRKFLERNLLIHEEPEQKRGFYSLAVVGFSFWTY